MTRDEFIDGYMKRSKLDASLRMPDGFAIGKWRRIALPCACGEDCCEGWAMISADSAAIEDHNRFNAPKADR